VQHVTLAIEEFRHQKSSAALFTSIIGLGLSSISFAPILVAPSYNTEFTRSVLASMAVVGVRVVAAIVPRAALAATTVVVPHLYLDISGCCPERRRNSRARGKLSSKTMFRLFIFPLSQTHINKAHDDIKKQLVHRSPVSTE
jgi:hypothetical protein